jgi:hypothetical protein
MARTRFGAAVKWGLIGAAATWFLDPDKGPGRRKQLQDKVKGVARERKDELADRFAPSGSANGRANGTEPAPEPRPDLTAEEVQMEPGAPGGPTTA